MEDTEEIPSIPTMMQEVEEPLLYNSETPDPSQSQLEVSINQDLHPPDFKMVPQRHRPMSKRRVLKNLYVMSFALFMFFLGFMALSNLESTMNSEKGLGTDSQAAIYISSMVAALLLPELMVKSIGCKKTLIISVLCSIPYIASNFYPRWETLMPTAVLLGLSAGPLTTSQAFYNNELALRYQKESSSEDVEVVMAKFFGFYSFFSENTQVWGNLISYYVLRPSMAPITNHTHLHCGVNFRKYDWNGTNGTNPNLQPPTEGKRDLLVGIYVLCGITSALLMAFFLDPLENDIEQDDSGKNKCRSAISRLVAAVKHAVKTDQILLVPLSIYCGMEISFYASDFTQAFIACSWGVHHVGFVTICFGVCGALMAIVVGPLVKCISQMSVIVLAAIINVITCALLFVWQPSPEAPVEYFAFAGVWGMTDAIWWSQVAALYGLMFPNDREAAFSNFFFWSFLGYFLSYSYANYFTVAVKINIMLVFLIVGITLYVVGQVKIKCCSPRGGYVVIGDSE